MVNSCVELSIIQLSIPFPEVVCSVHNHYSRPFVSFFDNNIRGLEVRSVRSDCLVKLNLFGFFNMTFNEVLFKSPVESVQNLVCLRWFP